MPKLVVVDGALLHCLSGSTPSPLTVTTLNAPLVDGSKTATTLDHQPGVNVKPFGVCAITGGPCLPATPAPWLPGEVSIPTSQFPILPDDSLLLCNVGSLIEVTYPGQTFFFVDTPPPYDINILKKALLNALGKLTGEMKELMLDILREMEAGEPDVSDESDEPDDGVLTSEEFRKLLREMGPLDPVMYQKMLRLAPDCIELPYRPVHPPPPGNRAASSNRTPEADAAREEARRNFDEEYDRQQTRRELSDDYMPEPPPTPGRGHLQSDAQKRIRDEAVKRAVARQVRQARRMAQQIARPGL